MNRCPFLSSQDLAAREKLFKGRNIKNLKRVKLKVTFVTENGNHSVLSRQTILDSGNKDIGAMDFIDAHPLETCLKGGERRVWMASEYNLSRDVVPIFQVFTVNSAGELEHREDLQRFIKQPDIITLKNTAIGFTSPAQPMLEAGAIREPIVIRLTALRKGDGYICPKSFPFVYSPCYVGNCVYCDFHCDG